MVTAVSRFIEQLGNMIKGIPKHKYPLLVCFVGTSTTMYNTVYYIGRNFQECV